MPIRKRACPAGCWPRYRPHPSYSVRRQATMIRICPKNVFERIVPMQKRVAAILALLVAVAGPLAGGNDPKAAKTPGQPAARDDKLPTFTPEREAAALTFVRQHHSELADLLSELKTSNEAEYQRAIAELFRKSEQLADTQARDPRRYELELAA